MIEEEIKSCNHMIIALANLQSVWHDNYWACNKEDENACKFLTEKVESLESDLDQMVENGCISRDWAEGAKRLFRHDVVIAKRKIGEE